MTEQNKCTIDEFETLVHESEKKYSSDLRKLFLKIFIGCCLFALYMLIPKTVWLVPSSYTNEKINPYAEPKMVINQANSDASAMKNISDYSKLIKIKSLKNKKDYYILPVADYSISARIKEKNRFFFLQNDFDKLALVDYGLTWGDMAKDEYFNKIYGHSNQTIDARRLVFNFKDKYYKQDYAKYRGMFNYMITHVSHTHVIPANKNVAKALRTARIGQVIKMDGYLVDLYTNDYHRFAMTSLSLSDEDEGSRGHGNGGGACEVMYVNKVQIENKVFE